MVFQRNQPRKKSLNIPVINYSKNTDIVTRKVVDYVVKTGEGETDFIVKRKVVITSRVNRQKEYNERAKGHSIYEVIDRYLETGDSSLFNKSQGVFVDISNLPENHKELEERLKKASDIWDKLPKDLKGDMTLTQFVDSMTDEKVVSYLKSKQVVSQPVEKVKETKKEGE